MASGQKYNDDIKEQAYAYFDTYNNMEFISRKLGVPVSTLWGWKRKYDKRADGDPMVEAVRAERKKQFVRSAWRSINMTQEILERRLRRAVEDEDLIDELLRLVDAEARGENVSQKLREGLLAKISALKCEELGQLVKTLGVLYDKQALAAGDPTDILGGIGKFEDL